MTTPTPEQTPPAQSETPPAAAPRPPQAFTGTPRPGAGGPRPYGGGPRPGGGGPRPGGARREGGGGRRYYPRRKVCFFCANKDAVLDYKLVEGLRRFISERARIEPRRKTGTCAKHQRTLARYIKRARQAGLIPFTTDTLRDLPSAH